MGAVKKWRHGKKKDRGSKKTIQKTRKELRKEKRQQKKASRALYYQKKKEPPGKYVLNPEKSSDIKNVTQKKDDIKNKETREHKKEKMEEKHLKEVQKQKKRYLREANAKEDKEIKRLEKQLKLDKRKTKAVPKSFAEDGLDYILEFCNEENRQHILSTEIQSLEKDVDAEFEHDLDEIIGKNDINNDNEKEKKTLSDESDSTGFDSSEDEAELNDSADEYVNDEVSSDELTFSMDDQYKPNIKPDLEKKGKNILHDNKQTEIKVQDINENSDDELEDGQSMEQSDNEDNEVWEDIYGRKRDKQGNIITNSTNKYIPPAARLKQLESSSTENDKLCRLKKQMKGYLNRLAEYNMHTIANQIEDLYMSNSRNDMNEILSRLMIEALVTPVLTPDRLVSEHMMLVAILHANVGIEVGAHFLLTIVRKIDEMLQLPQDVENKELDNLILMIAHLYNFKVYGHRLLYQILEKLSVKFSEKEIELILLILKTVGFPLRKDDPAALKELVLNLQNKASTTKADNSRVQFMLEVLLAIKNNNMSKIPQYDPSHVEHLKKQMKNFVRKGNTVTPFNITLDDLLHVDERGKWWVVGSAWTGSNDAFKPLKATEGSKAIFSQKLLELARKQRMNTDVRRNIFCILMTAEDYLDAFEKLHRLGLKDQQERELIYVIMDCCLHEKSFNPYYAVLAQKFCEYDRKYQMTIQFTLWDKLKILDSYTSQQLTNLARFLIHLFIEKSLPFSVLKVIQFTELDKPTVKLLRQIILGLLLHENQESCMQVFERISLSPQLQNLRESLRLFISHFLVRNINSMTLVQEQCELLKERAELVDKLLLTRGNKFIF